MSSCSVGMLKRLRLIHMLLNRFWYITQKYFKNVFGIWTLCERETGIFISLTNYRIIFSCSLVLQHLV